MDKITSLIKFKYQLNEKKIFSNLGLKSFHLAILLLSSAPVISFVLFIFSAIKGSIKTNEKYIKDKYNIPFLLSSLLMIINCLVITFDNNLNSTIDISSIWIGLSNWLPFFWCFWGFQEYLKSSSLRIKASKLFIIGTIPLLISGFCQYFLGFYGPFRFLNNLIVWYQRPLEEGFGVTGLFNNQNYAGAWLCIILPFCIGNLIINKKKILNKLIIIFSILSFVYMIILTTSRGAIFSIIFPLILLRRLSKKEFYTYFLIIIGSLLLIILGFFIFPRFQELISEILPLGLFFKKTSLINIQNFNNLPRVDIWIKSIDLINSNLFTGYGAGSFSSFYKMNGGIFSGIQHTHNIFIELAFNHGIICSLLITLSMVLLLINASKSYMISEKFSFKLPKDIVNLDSAWIISFFIFFFIHMFDITYYDGRISILAWILLSGLRSIIKGNKISIND